MIIIYNYGISQVDYFLSIKEKRNKVKLQHSLEELFLVALCAVISGAQDWVAVAALCSNEFENCFINWTRSLAGIIEGVIAIDGKTLRKLQDKSNNRNAIHMIFAWVLRRNF